VEKKDSLWKLKISKLHTAVIHQRYKRLGCENYQDVISYETDNISPEAVFLSGLL